jgi:hypothetical protein
VGEELQAFRKEGRWHDLKHYEMLEQEFTPNHKSAA